MGIDDVVLSALLHIELSLVAFKAIVSSPIGSPYGFQTDMGTDNASFRLEEKEPSALLLSQYNNESVEQCGCIVETCRRDSMK